MRVYFHFQGIQAGLLSRIDDRQVQGNKCLSQLNEDLDYLATLPPVTLLPSQTREIKDASRVFVELPAAGDGFVCSFHFLLV